VYRLVLTDAGRNEATTHLDHHFVHDYTPRPTHVVGMSPPLKKVALPGTWLKNQRGMKRGAVDVAHPVVDAVPSTCGTPNCKKQCANITQEHRQELALKAHNLWTELGEEGLRIHVERFIDVKESNLKSMKLHGEHSDSDIL
jgi:hypothetical protein